MKKKKRNKPTAMADLRGPNPFAHFLLNEAKRPGHVGIDARLLVSRFQGRTETGLRGEIEHAITDLVERGDWLDRLLRVQQTYRLRCNSPVTEVHTPDIWEALPNGGFMRRDNPLSNPPEAAVA